MSPEAQPGRGWRRCRFDEIAINVNERVDDPAEAGVEYYVGLEHLDSDSLAIRRWGSPADVQATKLRFRKGDIIFGRRRVYQRKLGVAHFDGICSAHAMVLRAKPDVALSEFLPFFMQSDRFMERAKEISVGSLSPTINWPALAREEFSLPPLDEQRRLSEVLRAADAYVDSLRALALRAQAARESWLETELDTLAVSSQPQELNSLVDRITVGIVVRPADLYVVPGRGIPSLRSLNVVPGRLVMEDVVHISHEGHLSHEKSRLLAGDVVIVRSGRPGDAAVIPEGMGELNCIDLIICGQSDALDPEYLCAILNSKFGRQQFNAGIAGTAQLHFNVGAFKRLRVPVPPRDTQSSIVTALRAFDAAFRSARTRLTECADLRRTLLSAESPA